MKLVENAKRLLLVENGMCVTPNRIPSSYNKIPRIHMFDEESVREFSSILPHDVVFLNKLEFHAYLNSKNKEAFEISDILCRDDAGELVFDEEYGKDVFQRLYRNDSKLDILVAVPRNRHAVSLQDKIGDLLGFIVCELGECKVEPNVWCVNLICTSKTHPLRIKASLLLGAMMFCIKRHKEYEQEAILELAGGYTNLAGFICYTKMGFNIDNELLFGEDICFYEVYNLPMSVDLSTISFGEVKRRALGSRSRVVTRYDDPTGIYHNSTRLTREELKREALACNLSYQIDVYDKNPSLFDPKEDADLIHMIKQAKKHLRPNQSILSGLLKYVRSAPSSVPVDEDEEWHDAEWTMEDSKQMIQEQSKLFAGTRRTRTRKVK